MHAPVDRLEALVEAAAFFAKAPAPNATGVAVVATSGGATIMAADKAELHGVELPQPGPAAAAILADRIPEFGSARNPCDVTAQVITDAGSLLACVDALLMGACKVVGWSRQAANYVISSLPFHGRGTHSITPALHNFACSHGRPGVDKGTIRRWPS